eukprot:jgi/Mesvir1/19801/Mv13093-RA.1
MMAVAIAVVVCIGVFAFIASIWLNKHKDELSTFKNLAAVEKQVNPGGPQLAPAGPAPAPTFTDCGGQVVPDSVRLDEYDITSRVTSRSSANWGHDKRAPKGAKPVFLRHLGPPGVKVAIIDGKVYAAKAIDKPAK